MNVALGASHYYATCGEPVACLNGEWCGEELGVALEPVTRDPLEQDEVAGQCFHAGAAAYASCWQVGNLKQLPD